MDWLTIRFFSQPWPCTQPNHRASWKCLEANVPGAVFSQWCMGLGGYTSSPTLCGTGPRPFNSISQSLLSRTESQLPTEVTSSWRPLDWLPALPGLTHPLLYCSLETLLPPQINYLSWGLLLGESKWGQRLNNSNYLVARLKWSMSP